MDATRRAPEQFLGTALTQSPACRRVHCRDLGGSWPGRGVLGPLTMTQDGPGRTVKVSAAPG